jgi:hypothetical protein
MINDLNYSKSNAQAAACPCCTLNFVTLSISIDLRIDKVYGTVHSSGAYATGSATKMGMRRSVLLW